MNGQRPHWLALAAVLFAFNGIALAAAPNRAPERNEVTAKDLPGPRLGKSASTADPAVARRQLVGDLASVLAAITEDQEDEREIRLLALASLARLCTSAGSPDVTETTVDCLMHVAQNSQDDKEIRQKAILALVSLAGIELDWAATE